MFFFFLRGLCWCILTFLWWVTAKNRWVDVNCATSACTANKKGKLLIKPLLYRGHKLLRVSFSTQYNMHIYYSGTILQYV